MAKTDHATQESSNFKQVKKDYHVFLNFGVQDADSAFNSTEEIYQVFLSFRGDTRKNFTDHLYRGLVDQAGLLVFRDTNELEPGENIRSELTKAIQNSRVSVIVFSSDYAVSKWCLDELVMILERKRNSQHQVVPVFYDVTPSEVRKQTGCFQKAFDYYEEKVKADTGNFEWKNKVSAWRLALAEVSYIVGKVLKNEADGYEGMFVKKIIEIVKKKLNCKNVDLRLNYGLPVNVKDTCLPLKNQLHKALNEARFLVFRDDHDLEDEKSVKSELFTAIQKSWLSIVVISKNYVYSECCLDELVMILECKRNSGHQILTVFYDLKPSDIRHQRKSVGKAFHRYMHKSVADKIEWKKKVNGWRVALAEVSKLAGLDLVSFDDGHGSEFMPLFMEKTITVVRDTLNRAALSNNYRVGMHSRTKNINYWLRDESSTAQILVVCGVTGTGKSTIAEYVYGSNYHLFESSTFLANIKAVLSKSSDGLHTLQNQILSCLSNGREEASYDVDWDITKKIKEAICRERVFIVLDDISDVQQFDELLQTRSFAPGSKIIVTTNNRWMLSLRADEIYKVYMVETLNDEESLELFSWYAFGQDHPKQVYIDQSVEAVKHCKGIPKALKFLGCLLFGRIDHAEWETELKAYGAKSETRFLNQLKLSYDSLQDDHDRVLFQHIACFFVGEDKDFTVEILNKCGFFTSIGIQNLVDRGLLNIVDNKLMMREGFQQMGRDIIRQESPLNPGNRTLLWHHKSSFDVVKKMIGTNIIKGLALDMHMYNEEKLLRPSTDIELKDFLDNTLLSRMITSENRITLNKHYLRMFGWLKNKVSKPYDGVELSTSALSRMENLELLKLNHVYLAGDYKTFPKNLRWLSWVGFPLNVIPTNLPLSNLVALDMSYSKLEKVWTKTKYLPALKFMDLSHSRSLSRTPDFSGLPNLERLYLKGCVSLVVISDSICNLDALELLDLEDCKSLEKLPKDIHLIKSLNKLVISGCSNLAEFGSGGGIWTRGSGYECIEYYP